MNRTNSKRLLSLILSLAMIFVFVCVPVSAADTAEEITEPEEISAVEVESADDVYAGTNAGIALIDNDADTDGSTATAEVTLPTADENGVITLDKEYALTSQYTVETNVTIDLNGNSITYGDGNAYYFLIVVNSGVKLTITDNSANGGGIIEGGIYISGEVEIQKGTIGTKTPYGACVSGESAKLTVSGGEVDGTNRGIEIAGGKATVTGGTITGGYYGIIQFGGELTFSNAAVTGTSIGILQYSGTVNITGGTVGGESCNRGMEIVAYDGETITNITGGTVSATNLGIYVADSTYSATLNIGAAETAADEDGETEENTETPSVSGSTSGAVYATTGATVNVYSGSVSSESGYGISVWGGEGAENPTTLNVYGGTISAPTEFGVVTNGSTYYTKINVSGGEISGAYGMYLPAMESSTTISGGTITGTSSGIELRAGTLTVTGGTIKSTYTGTLEVNYNGSGTTVVGAGIAVSQHSTNDEISVTITGGEISGCYGVYEVNTYYNKNSSEISVSISGNAVVSATSDTGEAVYSASMDSTSEYAYSATTVSVTGGTYSTDVSEYAEGCVVTTTTDKETGVTTYTYSTEGAVASIYDSDDNYVKTYSDLQTAINAATTEQTVRLLADVTGVTGRITIYKNITLDLGEHKISGSDSQYGMLLYTTQTLTITATTGGIEASSGVAVYNQKGNGTGTLTIDGGYYTSSSDAAIGNNAGILVVNSGTISTTANSKNAITCYETTASLAVNGGSISGTNYGIQSTGTLTVNGGEISGTKAGIYVSTGTATINDGTIKSETGEGFVDTGTANSITINGGTFIGYKHAVNVNSTGVTVSGGTFTATGTKADYAVAFYISGGNVTFSGGSFSGMYSTVWIASNSGGTYKLADGYIVDTGTLKDNNSGDTALVRNVLKAVAKVGDSTYYATLQSAIDAAASNATVTLLSDVEEDIEVAKDQTITLDLAGYKITNNTSHTITNYGTLTIVDNGHEDGTTVSGTVDNITHGKAAIVNYGTAYLYGGTFTRSLEAGASSSDNGGNSYYTVKNYNQMTIGNGANSVTVENDGCYSSCVANGYQNTSDKTSAQTVMNDTSIVPTLTINSNAKISGGIATVKNDDDATLIINGGTFANDNSNGCVIQNHSTATINDGTFTATNGAYAVYNCGCDAESDLGVLKIKGGTFSGDTYVVVLVSNANTAKVTIEGGTFKNTSGGDVFTSTGSNTDTVAVSSGTFSSAVPVNYCADGFTPSAVDETTGMYTVNEFSLGISTDGITASEVPATVYYNTGVKVVYVKVSSDNLKNYNANAYPTMTSEDYDNYIFAGWYSTSDGTSFTAMNETPSDTTAYAKFVDADLLTIQCVYTPNVEGYGNIWRFFTSIDTLKYKGVVFTVTSGGETVYTTSSPVTKAYMAYTVTGVEKTFAANQFSTSGAGVYVVTDYYADNSENKATSVTVTASWITPDGTTVTGSPVTFDATGKTEASVLTSTAVSE